MSYIKYKLMQQNTKEEFWDNALSTNFLYIQFNNDDIEEFINKGYIKSQVLDYGCGRGELIKQLVDKGLDVSGIDISNVGLTQVREFVGDRAMLFHGDYKSIVGKYNTIIMKLVYAFVEDKDECLKYMNEHLNDGGVLLVQTPVINDGNRGRVTKPGICVSEDECQLLNKYFTSVILVSEVDRPTGLHRVYVCYK